MRRLHFDPDFADGVDPAAEKAAAGKYQRVRTAGIDDGQFEIAVERCGADGAPHKSKIGPQGGKRVDLDQGRRRWNAVWARVAATFSRLIQIKAARRVSAQFRRCRVSLGFDPSPMNLRETRRLGPGRVFGRGFFLSMIPKTGYRFSEKIMLQGTSRVRPRWPARSAN